ncbi:MAG TPA: G1 family glutamic endopeptidase [Acidimicrobiales bacterium]|nr:G1 family glutamic endopeptidase [Acidimicrobiales bacterium]
MLVAAAGLWGTTPASADLTSAVPAVAPAAGRVHIATPSRLPALASGLGRVLPLSAGKPLPASWPHTTPLVRAVGTRQMLRDGAMASQNWSGYVDSGSSAVFTGVSASWTVPAVQAGTAGDSSSWVGIDGTATSDLVQAGTDQSWSPSGPVYYAWYEMLPAVATELGPVSPGDQISVTIAEGQPGSWTITVDDATEGTTWAEPIAYNAPGNSAEWVEEAPTLASDNTIEPLADFGTVQFNNLAVQGPGTASASAYPVYMVNTSQQILAYPDQYNPASGSFIDTYGSTTPPASPPAVPISNGPGSSTSSTSTSSSSTTSTTTVAAPTTSTAPALPAPQGQAPGQQGYWLAGRDGEMFAFGSAKSDGSAGPLHLQRPIAGIALTADRGGYWLVATDGGVFAFGDASYVGSLPADGIGPVGAGSGHHLSAPIVGIVPTPDGKGYLMVAKDGGVFAFGDAHFEGSCASIGGCNAPAVAVVPDATGGGYWLLLSNCDMVAFGNAPKIADRNCESSAVADQLVATSAARTPDGRGYWVLLDNGTTFPEGDAKLLGSWDSKKMTTTRNRAVAIVPTADGGGAWVVLANGVVDPFGDAPTLGDLAGTPLSAPITAAAGW